MGADERNQISDLYHAALARPASDRAVFLDEACAGDKTLRKELESLLQYESRATRFLETPAVPAANALPGLYDMTQLVGRELGPYRILAPLGQGGMGVVYRAHDSKLDRDMAIKILPQHLTEHAERRARFAREARVLATLNHPNIGAIYGVEEADGLRALVLELVEGTTLAERLEPAAHSVE